MLLLLLLKLSNCNISSLKQPTLSQFLCDCQPCSFFKLMSTKRIECNSHCLWYMLKLTLQQLIFFQHYAKQPANVILCLIAMTFWPTRPLFAFENFTACVVVKMIILIIKVYQKVLRLWLTILNISNALLVYVSYYVIRSMLKSALTIFLFFFFYLLI